MPAFVGEAEPLAGIPVTASRHETTRRKGFLLAIENRQVFVDEETGHGLGRFLLFGDRDLGSETALKLGLDEGEIR